MLMLFCFRERKREREERVFLRLENSKQLVFSSRTTSLVICCQCKRIGQMALIADAHSVLCLFLLSPLCFMLFLFRAQIWIVRIKTLKSVLRMDCRKKLNFCFWLLQCYFSHWKSETNASFWQLRVKTKYQR